MTIRSHKPIVWGLFAGGGTVAAFLAPVLMVVTGFMPLVFDDVLSYERMQAFVGNWLIDLVVRAEIAPVGAIRAHAPALLGCHGKSPCPRARYTPTAPMVRPPHT